MPYKGKGYRPTRKPVVPKPYTPRAAAVYNPARRVAAEYRQPAKQTPAQTVAREYRPITPIYNPSSRVEQQYKNENLPWYKVPIKNPAQLYAEAIKSPAAQWVGGPGANWAAGVARNTSDAAARFINMNNLPGANRLAQMGYDQGSRRGGYPLHAAYRYAQGFGKLQDYTAGVLESPGLGGDTGTTAADTGYGGYGGYGGGGGGGYDYTPTSYPFTQYQQGYAAQGAQPQQAMGMRSVAQQQQYSSPYATANQNQRWMQLLTSWRI